MVDFPMTQNRPLASQLEYIKIVLTNAQWVQLGILVIFENKQISKSPETLGAQLLNQIDHLRESPRDN